jgi:hypothetical protein
MRSTPPAPTTHEPQQLCKHNIYPWGNPLLPHGRQEGNRAGLEHDHPDLMEYSRELRTLGNLVRVQVELGWVTEGWDAVPGEWTPREARKANRDWRAL